MPYLTFVRPELQREEAPGVGFLEESGSTSAKFVGGEQLSLPYCGESFSIPNSLIF